MRITSTRQLKDKIKNIAKVNRLENNTLLQRFILKDFWKAYQQLSISRFRDDFILKGGVLIASMIGSALRSTMHLDTTIKGIDLNKEIIINIIEEIISINLDDNTLFKIVNIKNIHEVSKYDDYRVSLQAQFFSIRVTMKIDITTGDIIIPEEIEYSYKLMLEEESIHIKAYNLYTILAEKIETILSRNIANTRARDFYDIYILFKIYNDKIIINDLKEAIIQKSTERGTLDFF